MKHIIKITFFLLLYLDANAQLNFDHNPEYKFVFTEYLYISDLGLDTIVSNGEFELKIWIVGKDKSFRNLLRFYKDQNDPIIHADLKMLKFYKVGENQYGISSGEEFIIPDFLLDSLDLNLILKCASNLTAIDTSYCISVNSKKTLKYLKQNEIIDSEVKGLKSIIAKIDLSLLPSELIMKCNDKDMNITINPSNGLDYYFELLKPNMKNGFFYPSPAEFPKFIIEQNDDLYNVNQLINEINNLFRIIKIKID